MQMNGRTTTKVQHGKRNVTGAVGGVSVGGGGGKNSFNHAWQVTATAATESPFEKCMKWR